MNDEYTIEHILYLSNCEQTNEINHFKNIFEIHFFPEHNISVIKISYIQLFVKYIYLCS